MDPETARIRISLCIRNTCWMVSENIFYVDMDGVVRHHPTGVSDA